MLVLTVSGGLGMFSRNMVFPYIPLYILSLGGDPAEIGIPSGTSIVLTKVSGSHGVRARLGELGVEPGELVVPE